MHLIIDGYGGDPRKMQDAEFIYQILDKYPAQIGMVKTGSPKVSGYSGTQSQERGISGLVGLAESHISIHTFPQQSYVSIDIFSCKEFNAEQAIADFQDKLGLTGMKTRLINRPQPGIG
ncbi:S-adenosylmethionine decarboxylase [Chloroflexota bacterium]